MSLWPLIWKSNDWWESSTLNIQYIEKYMVCKNLCSKSKNCKVHEKCYIFNTVLVGINSKLMLPLFGCRLGVRGGLLVLIEVQNLDTEL